MCPRQESNLRHSVEEPDGNDGAPYLAKKGVPGNLTIGSGPRGTSALGVLKYPHPGRSIRTAEGEDVRLSAEGSDGLRTAFRVFGRFEPNDVVVSALRRPAPTRSGSFPIAFILGGNTPGGRFEVGVVLAVEGGPPVEQTLSLGRGGDEYGEARDLRVYAGRSGLTGP